ncbi:MAG: M23 family metallopeptidase [Ruminococcus sp.]|nr:M23 family metallopeptidase [Ruminococcus sp.]
MSNFLTNSRLGRKLGAKGVYITMGACVAALAAAGAVSYDKAMREMSDSVVIEKPSFVAPADNKADSVPKDESSALPLPSGFELTITADSSSEPAEDSPADADIKTQPNVMPVNGEIIRPFSNGELVKDETLGVWKTHDGVDIKADVGTPVKAMNKGTVTEVKEDPLWGNCIVIDHGNTVFGYYYSLTKAMNVAEGDTVNAGDIIGAVGDSAECEAAELSHLHFGLKRNGEWIDPLEYIGMAYTK